MKFISTLLIATALSTPLWAEDYRTGAPVVAAEVYLQGGFVTRRAVVDMTAGSHRIMLPMSEELIMAPEFRTSAGMTITSVSFQADMPDPEPYYSARQQDLKAALDAALEEQAAFGDRRKAVEARIDAARARAAFVDAIRPSSEEKMSVEELMAAASFVQSATAEIAAEIASAEAALRDMEEEARTLATRVAEAQAALDRAGLPEEGDGLLVLDVVAVSDGPATLEIRALTGEIGWGFTYDAELVRGDAPEVRLERNVNLWQNTGHAWDGVEIALETAQFERGTDPSWVGPNRARIYDPQLLAKTQRGVAADAFAEPMMEMAPAVEEAISGFSGGDMQVNGLAVSYAFDRPISLAPGENAILGLDTLTFEARDFVQASPRFDNTAFLMAEFTNTSGATILSSGATYSRDGQMVGGRPFPQIAPGETVTLGFGPYDGILTSVNFDRTDTGDRGVIRSRQTRAEVVTFTVENLTGERQDVRTLYALPFSEQEDLVIETTPSQPWDEIDEEGRRNVAVWNLSLAPGEKRDVRLDMSLSWPEGQELDWRP